MQCIYSSYLFENIFFKAMQYATVFPVLGNSITCVCSLMCVYMKTCIFYDITQM